jgi:frataxin-like iron-binding protein CyaY
MVTVVGVEKHHRTADRILEAVRAQIDKRRTALNSDTTIRSVTIVVKMKTGSTVPRVALMNVETEDELT